MVYLTNVEKETIYTYNEGEPTAECFTYNKKLQNQLIKLSEERPDDCQFLSDNGNGGLTYRIPKKWIKIRPTRVLSEEQRKAAAERLALARNSST